MKKLSNVLFGFMLSICFLLVPVTVQAAGNCVEYNGSNVESQDYSRWASTIKSYLTTASDGGLMLVQAGTGIEGAAAVYYDSSYNFIGKTFIPQELPIFGAFYETEDYYFLLTGQENPDQDAAVEVYRITKYDKAWNRISSVGLYDCNTTVPFDAGSARMVHQGKYLLIRTCHKMYKSSDGLNHQANVTIQVDMDSMQITDSYTRIMNSGYGYVSHSFNQFIRLDNNKIVALDHGDAHPRSAALIKYATDFTGGTFVPSYGQTCRVVDVLEFPGRTGENATGASLGGFEVSERYYLVAGNSVVQDNNNLSRSTRNIFVAAVDKDTNEINMHWITNYEEGDGTTSTPQLVKISAEQYMLLWSREDVVYYTMLNGAGEQTGSIYHVAGNLSDCVPLVCGNKVVWYTWGSSTVTFYEISLDNPAAVTKQERSGGHDYVNGGVTDGYAQLSCSACGASDQVKVYESFMPFFNSTGEGYYWSNMPTDLQVGDIIRCMYSGCNPSDAEDVIEVVVDNPNVVTGKEGWPGYILTMKGGGTTNVTFRSKYNPSVSYTYTITVEGDPSTDPDIGQTFAIYDGCTFTKNGAGQVRCYAGDGTPVINEFKCDGTYTYYFQLDGTAMRDRLTYHPDGEHIIYFDADGHEVFSEFANIRKSIAGDDVDDMCFFNVFGYMYVDTLTYDKSGTKLYYVNPYGVLERKGWFAFSGKEFDAGLGFSGRAGGYGYANPDCSLLVNTVAYDWEDREVYLQGDGHMFLD